ncbi:hypothetical protein [Leptodesmis sp.]|uniref:hypothetical protein n=1 Tax=Leptodesmis sp. TaxID=3100501 RepID=UPI0040534BE3
MMINNLNHLESILDVHAISGGVFVGVTADAIAIGDSSTTLTRTTAIVKPLGNGGSIGKGRGIAIASGDNSLAGVDVYGFGDGCVSPSW